MPQFRFTLVFVFVAVAGILTAQASIQKSVGYSPFSDTEIRVRLNEAASVVRVRGFDLRIFGRRLATAADRESRWELRCEDGRIRAHKISGQSSSSWVDLAEPAVIRSPAGFLEYEGKQYREQLLIYSSSRSFGSTCEVVNQVNLEKYLEGLVNAEFSSRWNDQAIGAQVVAARTYALFQMRNARALGARYDIDATTHDQVYDGSMKEDPRAARIVQRTRGLVLTIDTAHGIEPLKAYYSSNCGGMTELPSEVWGTSNTGFRRVVCPYGAHAPGAHWSFDLSSDQVVRALRQASYGAADVRRWPHDWRQLLWLGKLHGIQIGSRDASGRVERIYLTFELGGRSREWAMSGARFREWLGPTQFKSTAFSISLAFVSGYGTRQGNLVWHFTGRGNGHGVGLCQWGAKAMGERGFSTVAILKFYYPGAVLRKLW